ncbi:poly-beta-1,6 N-acetyl-D-glucosamine export porin PgaA [Crenothrix sp.]|uniref:poly-beta-1,6 N-acetyl-D-glucosamine export porin PgaA n=1 Tax=Crenothrix sp. TaxID=3100433 RepID=UPI00374DA376
MSICLHIPLAFSDTTSDEQYQQALQKARSGDTAQALKKLEQLIKNNPETTQYQYDYIQILSWAGRDADVLKQEANINIDYAPVYVLEAVAKSARNLKNFQRAEYLYRRAVAAEPGRIESQLGLALVQIDQKKTDPAINLLKRLERSYPQNIDVLLALAYGYEVKMQFLTAIKYYEKILTLQPSNTEATRGIVFDLIAAGAIPIAYEKAQANRELFSDEEWAHFNWDVAATKIRWGEISPLEDEHRFDETDDAIKAVDDNIASIKTLQLKEPEVWNQRAHIDRMVALRHRIRMQDVINEYDALQQHKVIVPAYARSAAADAYLYLEQPEKARDLYLSIIKESPKDFNARSSLVYAYLEAEQFDDADKLAKQLAKEQPEKLRFVPPDGPAYTRGNPKKTSTELTAADMSAYADKLDEASDKIEDLYSRGSFNPDIRHDLARTYYFRGWPRKAEKHFDMAQNMAPKHLGLKVGHAEVMRDLKEYRKTEKEVVKLAHDYPEDKGVQKQVRLWNIHNDWEFKSFNSGGLSTSDLTNANNNPKGSEDIRLDNYLYTPPLDYNYRIFAHQGWGTALFPRQITVAEPNPQDLRGYIQTYGLGVEYSARNILATSELHYDIYTKTGVGINLGVNYEFNDHWQLFAGFDSLDNNISLRALANGIRASTEKLQLTYRVHESRQFDLAAFHSAYSEGDDKITPTVHYGDNDRFAVSGTYFERWYSGPRYKFGTFLSGGYSANTNHNTITNTYPYFNPKSDTTVSLTLDNDYLTYRYYDTTFYQRLALSVGNYWQEDFGSNVTGNIQYEHRWKTRDRFELTYGASHAWTAYDGIPTRNWIFYLNTDIRF